MSKLFYKIIVYFLFNSKYPSDIFQSYILKKDIPNNKDVFSSPIAIGILLKVTVFPELSIVSIE
tara:strand:+ start:252 stop:443 length:192 start_codon:yes stop_codon:yes gene_type:complete